MKDKTLPWLMKELPQWKEKGWITPEGAEEIAQRISLRQRETKGPALKEILTAFGALLMGLGIILLFAYNWNLFSRLQKSGIAALPYLVSLYFGFKTLGKTFDSAEGPALFQALTLGALLSMISQIYNLPGNPASLLLLWMLLSAPLIYLFRSRGVALLYGVALTFWAALQQIQGGLTYPYWVLLAVLIPRAYYPSRSLSLQWILGLTVTVNLGIILEKILPGLWLILYPCLFALLYLLGKNYEEDAPLGWSTPLQTIGLGGWFVMVFLLSYYWPWEGIGWHHLGDNHRGVIPDVLTALALFSAYLVYFLKNIRRGRLLPVLISCAPLVYLGIFLFTSQWEIPLVPHLLTNLYILIVALGLIVAGAIHKTPSKINSGVFLLSMQILLRFVLVEELLENLILRGVIFMALGGAFFLLNRIMMRFFPNQGAQ